MRGKPLPGFSGYLRRQAAMHPSVCALRRIHRPVCGVRIARRALKRACALRPLRCREAAKTGAVSEGRSYVFYRRTGDNKRSDGRLPHEKQLSPPQAALDSAAPCRGGFANGFHLKGSPTRGAGGVSRLRGAAPGSANILPGHRKPSRPCGITGPRGAAPTQNRSVTPPQSSPAGVNARPTI